MNTRILHTLLFTPISRGRWGLPVLFWGSPGCGKTDIIEAYGASVGLHVETLSPGERGEGAFGVTPIPTADGQRLAYPAPDWTDGMKDGGVVFLDEITLAEPALQKYIMALLHARRIGSHTLGPRVRVLAAGNAVEEAAGGWDLALPTANRQGHMQWDKPTPQEWSDWLLGGANGHNPTPTIDALKEEARVLKAWPGPFAKASGVVAGFISRRGELLHKMPKPGSPDASKAWASHRTWEMAVRALAGADVHGLGQVDRETLVESFVGKGAASEMLSWLAQADLPDPAELLDGKVKFKHEPSRLDRTAAVLSSCAALVSPDKADRRKERAGALWGIMDDVTKDAIDVGVPAARVLAKAQLGFMKEARSCLNRMEPALAMAGIGERSAR